MVPYNKTIDDYRNTDRNAYRVEKVVLKGKYGDAYGYPLDPDGNQSGDEMCIPCCGCGEWILIDKADLDYIASRPVVPPEYVLDFGKYKGKTLAEVYREDPGYIKWLGKKEIFNIDIAVFEDVE